MTTPAPASGERVATRDQMLSRGWMGLAGILGAHLVLCDVLVRFGTDDQKARFDGMGRQLFAQNQQ